MNKVKQILNELERLHKTFPEQRFGQLLYNYGGIEEDPFNVTDNKILNELKSYETIKSI